MFSGLSAFPLTPFAAGKPDEAAFLRLLRRLTDAKVDSLGVLGPPAATPISPARSAGASQDWRWNMQSRFQ